ncbi:hypothetical protein ACWD0Z_06480 [Streptomyces sp. NPDC003007]
MNTRDYPAERIERYVNALNDADTYAQLSKRTDRERLARAVMAVADAETDPVYKSGYDTGRMHAGGDRARVLREAADEAESAVALFEDSDEGAAAAGAMEGLAIRFRRMAREAEGKSSPAGADATPRLTDRQTRLLDAIRTHGGAWNTHRVLSLYALTDPGVVQRGTARRDLAALHRAGHLVLVDDPDNRHYALHTRKDGRS